MIRVLLAIPPRLLRDLIRAVCETDAQIQIVGCVNDKKAVLDFSQPYDLVILSANLPSNESFVLVSELARSANNPAAVVVGLPDTPALIVHFLEAGAAGPAAWRTECGRPVPAG